MTREYDQNFEATEYCVTAESGSTAVTTTGSWQDIYLPSGLNIKRGIVQVHDDNDSNYDYSSYNSCFLYRASSSSGSFIRCPELGRALNVAVRQGGYIGQIKAEAGKKVVIMSEK